MSFRRISVRHLGIFPCRRTDGKIRRQPVPRIPGQYRSLLLFPAGCEKRESAQCGNGKREGEAPCRSHRSSGRYRVRIRDVGNYFVFRINALEDNAILFEFRHSKRFQLATVDIPIASNRWYDLKVETAGSHVKAYLDGKLLMDYEANRTMEGYLGLWTKADSVTEFDSLTVE